MKNQANSFMVVRPSKYSPTGTSYTGPFASETAAQREAVAWQAEGVAAEVKPYTAELRAKVRAWKKAKEFALNV